MATNKFNHGIDPTTATDAQIRAWAVINGLEPGAKGRIAAPIIVKFTLAYVRPSVPKPPVATAPAAAPAAAPTAPAAAPAKVTGDRGPVTEFSVTAKGAGAYAKWFARIPDGVAAPAPGPLTVKKNNGETPTVTVTGPETTLRGYRVVPIQWAAKGVDATAPAPAAAPVATAPAAAPTAPAAAPAMVTRATAPVATVTARIEAVVNPATRVAEFVVITATGSRIVCQSLADAETVAGMLG